MNSSRYSDYHALTLRHHDDGILEIVMGAEQSANKKLSTADHNMHRELSMIWQDIDRDPDSGGKNRRHRDHQQAGLAVHRVRTGQRNRRYRLPPDQLP